MTPIDRSRASLDWGKPRLFDRPAHPAPAELILYGLQPVRNRSQRWRGGLVLCAHNSKFPSRAASRPLVRDAFTHYQKVWVALLVQSGGANIVADASEELLKTL